MLLDIIQDNNNLQVSYWGEDGKTHIEIVKIPEKEKYIWLTAPKSKSDERSRDFINWDGKPVWRHKIDFTKKDDLRGFSNALRYRYYEILDKMDDDFKNRVFSFSMPECFFIDIENKMQDGKPDAEKADKPITVIGVCCPNDTIMVLSAGYNLTTKQQESVQRRMDDHFSQVNRKFKFAFRYFETEYDLLYFFFSKLVPRMAMITGWNVEDYDWRYLYNRAKQYGIDVTMASPGRKMTGQIDRPAHVGLIDYLKAYKKWTWNTNENYKLDTIGEKLCGIKKVQHSESLDDMLENDFEKYVYYNAIDCGLVKLIHEKCNALTCGLTTAWLGNIKAMDCFSTTYIPENLLRISFGAEHKVLGVSPDGKQTVEAKKYRGAFVKQPVPGLHRYCACNDYASLYPSLMRQFNIGPETLVTKLDENDEEGKKKWKEKGYIVCATGAVYQKEDGHLKKIITNLYFKRKDYKKTSFKYTQFMYDLKDMLKHNSSEEELKDYIDKNGLDKIGGGDIISKTKEIINYCSTFADIYNNYQLGTKVVINGIYGAFGFAAFYFYNPTIAESVTQQGRDAILNAERLMNKWAEKVWLIDKNTHNKMGIKITNPKAQIKPITRYIDTDSIYSSYYQIVSTTDWMKHKVWRLTKIDKKTDQKDFTYVSSGGYPTLEDAQAYFDINSIDTEKYSFEIDQIEPSGREFVLTLYRVFMNRFLKKIHEDYANNQGTPNILDFELEAYNEAGIWLAKKKYLKNMTWAEPNVYYNSCDKIKATGVEIAQTSSSPWVKKQLTDLVKWIFKQDDFSMSAFVSQLKKVKEQFMLQSVDIISLNKGMNKYNDYVLSDVGEIQLQPKSMVTVQGASLYNYLVNSDDKYKKKYSMLFDADKLCVVYIKPTNRYTYWKKETAVLTDRVLKSPGSYKLITDKKKNIYVEHDCRSYDVYTDIMSKNMCEALSYPAGSYPYDMCEMINIDYDRMFELLVLAPINRIVSAMGYNEIDISMSFEEGFW